MKFSCNSLTMYGLLNLLPALDHGRPVVINYKNKSLLFDSKHKVFKPLPCKPNWIEITIKDISTDYLAYVLDYEGYKPAKHASWDDLY